jgi:hypothetical protein
MMMKERVISVCIASVVMLGLSAMQARADIYGFAPITFNTDGAVAAQLSLVVTQSGSDVLFTFENDGPLASTIKLVTFDDSAALLGTWTILDSPPDVDFKWDDKNLPGGNTLNPGFVTDFGYGKDGSESGGVDPGESLGIKFSLLDSKSFADVIAALDLGMGNSTPLEGTLRVGIHVGSIGDESKSDAFVLTPPKVPLPAGVILGMLGLSAAGWKLRRFA